MLGFGNPNHQLGIGKVVGMFETNLKNRIAVGIIDDDKVKPKELNNFEETGKEQNIIRLVKNNHSILVISPAFEAWVFENAEAVQVDPAKYGFHTRKYFKKVCKQIDASKNQALKQFLNTLKQKNAPGLVQLKIWICECAGIEEGSL